MTEINIAAIHTLVLDDLYITLQLSKTI